jgi:hypothetical protein
MPGKRQPHIARRVSKALAVVDLPPAALPKRTRSPHPLSADGLTQIERRFLDALYDGAKSLKAAYLIASPGCAQTSAATLGSSMLDRPHVLRALHEETGRMRALGRLRGTARLLDLVDGAKSEYVQADAAKWLAGHEEPAGAAGGQGFAINIDLSEPGQVRIRAIGPGKPTTS